MIKCENCEGTEFTLAYEDMMVKGGLETVLCAVCTKCLLEKQIRIKMEE